jgi:hypothetical protein
MKPARNGTPREASFPSGSGQIAKSVGLYLIDIKGRL